MKPVSFSPRRDRPREVHLPRGPQQPPPSHQVVQNDIDRTLTAPLHTESQKPALGIPPTKAFMVTKFMKEVLATVDLISGDGHNINILVEGPQGSGKSELPAQYAASRKRPLATLEVGRLSESSQVFGYMDLQDGNMTYVKGLFTEAITTPNCVVHLQEINRPENDKALNAIFSVLDDTHRSIWLDELRGFVKVAPGVTFFASLNQGFEFIGTLPLDEALKNRFAIKLSMPSLPVPIETNLLCDRTGVTLLQAEGIMAIVTPLRNNSQAPLYISVRDTLNIATLVRYGLSVEEALRCTVGSDLDRLESILLQRHVAGESQVAPLDVFELL